MTHPNSAVSALESLWQQHKWPDLATRQLTYTQIEPVLDALSALPMIRHQHIGRSYLGTPIRRFSIGQGPLVLLAWTQMHGNESTATAAVLDWLKLLSSEKLTELPPDWQQLMTLHVIPMLNPDGAAAGTRETAQGIDMNRDALARQTPEGRLLWQQVQELKPSVAFNLHDQNPYYAAGPQGEPATIAFLAPAYHPDKHVDGPRLRAKQLIAHMRQILSHYLPKGIGRYDDSYSERSFGDAIAGCGASTILIESGAHRDDSTRQVARRLNVIALQAALSAVLSGVYQDYSLADYYAIPANFADGFVDIKITQLTIDDGQHAPYLADILLKCRDNDTSAYVIEFVGDARGQRGLRELSAQGLTWKQLPRLGAAAEELLQLVDADR
ncbi:M14 family zinc carboxypeptidase [Pseudidiomarina insulisalsae]|uniref:Peptidase M14 n=1 Tax=Pseudidiomarina insulisalsae TaxID=575789 RepID=A0A432YPS4_9GAMM|nr:M14 family zinc carboxypeptidase [Pseudidiomarina insulisalsae]RUO63079.1 peptidase M14 [Pseudidiomarina insulisalsae]